MGPFMRRLHVRLVAQGSRSDECAGEVDGRSTQADEVVREVDRASAGKARTEDPVVQANDVAVVADSTGPRSPPHASEAIGCDIA